MATSFTGWCTSWWSAQTVRDGDVLAVWSIRSDSAPTMPHAAFVGKGRPDGAVATHVHTLSARCLLKMAQSMPRFRLKSRTGEDLDC
jgi:hypothetical protein